MDEATLAKFQRELGAMGYRFQFVTLAGFHALNLSMFDLARAYKENGMAAYSRLQEKEFGRERDFGYEAVKHQRFAGTGYFDAVQQTITSGMASTLSLREARLRPSSLATKTDRPNGREATGKGNGKANGNGQRENQCQRKRLTSNLAKVSSSAWTSSPLNPQPHQAPDRT